MSTNATQLLSHESDPSLASEARLIQRAIERDVDAFEELAGRHRTHLYTYLVHTMQEPRAAEKALQATFLAAWKGLPEFGGEVTFACWLAGICAHEVVRLRSTASISPYPSRLRLVNDGPTCLRREVAATVASLPFDRRVAFVIGELAGATDADVADALDINSATVRRHIQDALLAILERIEVRVA